MTLSEPAAGLLKESNNRKAAVQTEPTSAHTQEIITRTQDAIKDSRLIAVLDSEMVDLTTVGWRLASRSGWEFQPWLPTPTSPISAYVVVDNVAPTRTASRRAREILSFDSADAVVTLVPEPLPEADEILQTE